MTTRVLWGLCAGLAGFSCRSSAEQQTSLVQYMKLLKMGITYNRRADGYCINPSQDYIAALPQEGTSRAQVAVHKAMVLGLYAVFAVPCSAVQLDARSGKQTGVWAPRYFSPLLTIDVEHPMDTPRYSWPNRSMEDFSSSLSARWERPDSLLNYQRFSYMQSYAPELRELVYAVTLPEPVRVKQVDMYNLAVQPSELIQAEIVYADGIRHIMTQPWSKADSINILQAAHMPEHQSLYPATLQDRENIKAMLYNLIRDENLRGR